MLGPDERKFSGKAVQGIISIKFNVFRDKNEIEILSEKQVINKIFDPMFSTADKSSKISGRGVGMLAVKEVVEKEKGTIEVFSKLGFGTRFKIIVPT